MEAKQRPQESGWYWVSDWEQDDPDDPESRWQLMWLETPDEPGGAMLLVFAPELVVLGKPMRVTRWRESSDVSPHRWQDLDWPGGSWTGPVRWVGPIRDPAAAELAKEQG